MTVAASPPGCKQDETEDEAYRRIAAAIDFMYRVQEDAAKRHTRRVLQISKLWKELNADRGHSLRDRL
jgi:hypothetical protein